MFLFFLLFFFSVSAAMAQEAQNGEAAKEVMFAAVKPRLYLEAPKANDAVQFYKAAFGAEEVNRVVHPKRKAEQELPLLLSAELKLGSSSFLVSDFVADDSVCPYVSCPSSLRFFLFVFLPIMHVYSFKKNFGSYSGRSAR